ncbi:hypothetical protein CHLNCDRAFT_54354 [Chlorella variabilis]|uniref:DUF541 domain-containing protein n=1 Tax=Chlorella variabilis TaxID=554065 RepID=E1ZNK3_CHLVA|nr:hypothetical protein CHLNCDRAFT_54354 [Chlorella variabilis]EFN52622.1 hypothetical protein CHLNCDRAFT_54354 [Chlorella variabilis]|eukprot:XP_005844724.1 hypothetical protein CHLNCDRAFT_54354 [Chlorella variabilis]
MLPRLHRGLLLLLASSLIAHMGNAQSGAQQCEDPKAGKLSVTGSATVTEMPDNAKVFLSVSVTKPTAAEAREEAAATADAVMAAVGGVEGINGASDISTSDISLQPNYIWVQETGQNRITGYVFTQQISVKISNLTSDTLGAVVDTAVKAGANNLQACRGSGTLLCCMYVSWPGARAGHSWQLQVSSIQIELSPALRRQAMDQARVLAVEDAANTAQILADAAKVTLGPVKSLADSNIAPPTPYPMPAAGKESAAFNGDARTATPVVIGTAEVIATVSVEYAVMNA